MAYLDKLGADLHGDAYIFRNRSGQPYSEYTLSHDFAAVRTKVFDALDRRTLADFRRSGAVEAIKGGAPVAKVAHAMGNSIGTSNSLFKTYIPVNVTSIKDVMEARIRGRARSP